MTDPSAGMTDAITIALTVNGKPRRIQCNPSMSLARLLRNRLHLTGVKIGCDSGHCGACTVIMNGKAVRSCRIKAGDTRGASIITIEGLRRPDGTLHPLQQAFLDTGAVQCGFCTPGMIMAAYALLLNNPSPDPDEIRQALQGNLCRCTGYQPIVEAVLLAARRTHGNNVPSNPLSVTGIGTSVHRVDGPDKVTGEAQFTEDIPLKSPLYGAIAWAPVPSGRLVTLHTDNARKVPGVRYILSANDIPGINALGRWRTDRPVFVKDRIRYIGDALAMVLADTPDAARTGARHIDADIAPISGLFNTEDALNSNAPVLHADGNRVAEITISKQDDPDESNTSHTNTPNPIRSDATMEFSDRFKTQFLEHAVLETENAAAWMDGECLVVAAPSQNVYFDRLELMRILGLKPREIQRIRVIETYTGGAFGKHEDLSVQPYAALGTWLTRRPVRMVLNRSESFRTTTKRHPMIISHETAVNPDHCLVQQRIHIQADTGAYASWAPNILRKSAVHATGPYRIPNVDIYGESIHTNNAFSGAFRGFGAVQVQFAAERHMDRIARRLEIDPLTFRCRNGFRPGDKTATGQKLRYMTPIPDLLHKAAERLPWPGPARGTRVHDGHAVGVGLAAGFYGIGYGNGIPDKGQVELVCHPGGQLEILTSAIDYGQGAATVFAQLASEILDIPLENIRVITGDTHRTPDSGSTVASRQTVVTGNAVVKACHKLNTLRRNHEPADQPLRVKSRVFLASQTIDAQSGHGDVYRTYAAAAAAAEVRVNRDTGTVRIRRVVSVHDSGTIINPAAARSQVTGGIMMAAGMTLWENYSVENGRPKTADFTNYKIARFADIPEMDIIFMPTEDPAGPCGAKGLGEPAMLAAGPAILNAVCDAVDTDFDTLPVTPDTIRNALKKQF